MRTLFLVGLLLIPLSILGGEICLKIQGCRIDQKGLCIDCVEGENKLTLQSFEQETLIDNLEEPIVCFHCRSDERNLVKSYFSKLGKRFDSVCRKTDNEKTQAFNMGMCNALVINNELKL